MRLLGTDCTYNGLGCLQSHQQITVLVQTLTVHSCLPIRVPCSSSSSGNHPAFSIWTSWTRRETTISKPYIILGNLMLTRYKHQHATYWFVTNFSSGPGKSRKKSNSLFFLFHIEVKYTS
jgi:hypothetical protein